KPVTACPSSKVYQLRKTVRRHKFAFSAAAAVATALILGFGVSTWLFFREKEARRRAVAAEKTQRELRQQAEAAQLHAEAGEKALIYWQALNALPILSDSEANSVRTGEGMAIEASDGLAASYDETFKLLRQAANMKSGCDWAANLAEFSAMPRGFRVRDATNTARFRARVALFRGHPEAACQDLLATIVLGRNV